MFCIFVRKNNMKLKEGIKIEQLKDYGFEQLNEDYKRLHNLDDSPLEYMEGYLYDLGHSRRGQFYYLICSELGNFSIYASDPDGSGGALSLTKSNNVIFKLMSDSVIDWEI